MTSIKNFTDLNTWQEAHKLAILIYRYTDKFPSKEIYGLTSQIRRSAISVSSNVAEGFSRRTRREKIQFYSISLGSLTELQNQLVLSRDVGYLDNEYFEVAYSQTITVQKLTNGLIKGVSKIHNT